jgi:hypothetical protein
MIHKRNSVTKEVTEAKHGTPNVIRFARYAVLAAVHVVPSVW